jgi:hypothetical protein
MANETVLSRRPKMNLDGQWCRRRYVHPSQFSTFDFPIKAAGFFLLKSTYLGSILGSATSLLTGLSNEVLHCSKIQNNPIGFPLLPVYCSPA